MGSCSSKNKSKSYQKDSYGLENPNESLLEISEIANRLPVVGPFIS